MDVFHMIQQFTVSLLFKQSHALLSNSSLIIQLTNKGNGFDTRVAIISYLNHLFNLWLLYKCLRILQM